MMSVDGGRMVSASVALPVAPAVSLAATPRGKLPCTVGVPLSVPSGVSVMPAGRAPLVIDQP